ncbi:MAG: MltA domain-containing protein [Deltaproteobacteria bacterium]|nr:MltA domain-containing protein [Deltaproteobacteria bacterium]
MGKNALSKIVVTLLVVFVCSCSSVIQRPLPVREGVHFQLVPEENWPLLKDDLDPKSLEQAVTESLKYLSNRTGKKIFLGSREIRSEEILSGLTLFLHLLQKYQDSQSFQDQIKSHYHLFRAVLDDKPLPLLMTGYYEPTLQGSRWPSSHFQYPVYRQPEDLLFIDTSKFSKQIQGSKWIGRTRGNQVIPYYTRREIEQEGPLAGKNLEILWVDDPVKLFFMQIQGSGQVSLEDGSLVKLGYQGTNGHPYFAIGKELIRRGIFQPEALSLQSISAYLQGHPEEQSAIMNLNPSYIFFQEAQGGPYGSLGLPLTPGRSIAADQTVFPAAGLAWTTGMKPAFDEQGHIRSWEPFGRWVCIQDSGGAIKGPSRVDLFWGNGLGAELAAGHLRHQGALYILLKK